MATELDWPRLPPRKESCVTKSSTMPAAVNSRVKRSMGRPTPMPAQPLPIWPMVQWLNLEGSFACASLPRLQPGADAGLAWPWPWQAGSSSSFP